MGNFVVSVIVWSFSIYGMIDFIKETWLDVINYIGKGIKFLKKVMQKWLIKS